MPLGPGPVFVVELVAASRRWQTYAARAGLIAALGVAITAVWLNETFSRYFNTGGFLSLREYAELGSALATAVLGTQLALVLLAAPAATAGAICLDRARGNLTLLMATELSAIEFVVGKLFARLMPVLGLVVASLPVLFAITLLGGVSPDLLVTGFTVLVGTAVLGCALALAFSLCVGKAHEALLLTYFAFVVWLTVLPLAARLITPWLGPPPAWLVAAHPLLLLIEFARATGEVKALFLAITLTVAATCVLVTAARLRRVTLGEAGRAAPKVRRGRAGRRRALRLLERDPVRWYERFRRRPSWSARLVWWLFALLSLGGTGWVVFVSQIPPGHVREQAVLVGTFQIGVGLLLVTVNAVTALSDERVRGSLDILLTTPVTTGEILWAKWRTAFATAPKALALTGVVALAVWFHWRAPQPAWVRYEPSNPSADTILALTLLHPLACAAMLTSFSLWMATRLRRPARAVGMAVAAFTLVVPGWAFLSYLFLPRGELTGLGMISPFYTTPYLVEALENTWNDEWVEWGAGLTTTVHVGLAAYFFALALIDFNRKVGRVSLPAPKAERYDLREPIPAPAGGRLAEV